ncbi:c-type cytochrome [Algibacter pacificus]|uniref:c-type cytochrome n=1 Tax=Algibacter pacificus TaxID=2599389 RepID=UPI0011CB9D2E|nr:hypothetical protein [Algibacter pacificus]
MKIAKYVLVAACSAVVLVGCGGKEEKKKKGFTYEETKTKPKEVKVEETAIIDDAEVQQLLTKNTCVACHTKDKKIIGPSFIDIAKRNYSNQRIVELIYKPEPSNWPDYAVPMAPLPNVPRGEALKLAAWINSLQ